MNTIIAYIKNTLERTNSRLSWKNFLLNHTLIASEVPKRKKATLDARCRIKASILLLSPGEWPGLRVQLEEERTVVSSEGK